MSNEIRDLFSLQGRVAVVLGGTSGIGQAITRGYRKAGATVIASSRGEDKVNATADEIESAGGKTLRQTSDIHDYASLERLRDAVLREFQQVDILVVTSGMWQRYPSTDYPDEEFARVTDANLNGSFRANQIFGRHMLERKAGSITNIASLTSYVAFPQVTAYSASKAAVLMLTKSLACEWAPSNVRVNAIAPGVFRTPLNSAALDDPQRAAGIIAKTPMGRLGQLDELVGAAIFLASDAASFVTGQILAVDGGFLAKGI